MEAVKIETSITGPTLLASYFEGPSESAYYSNTVISSNSLLVARENIVARLWKIARMPDFWNLGQAGILVYRLKKWSEETAVRDWIKDVLSEPKLAVKFLRSMITELSSSGGQGTRHVYILPAKEIEWFTDLAVLESGLQGQKLEHIETLAFEGLKKAIANKNEGRPYNQIGLLVIMPNGTESTNPADMAF